MLLKTLNNYHQKNSKKVGISNLDKVRFGEIYPQLNNHLLTSRNRIIGVVVSRQVIDLALELAADYYIRNDDLLVWSNIMFGFYSLETDVFYGSDCGILGCFFIYNLVIHNEIINLINEDDLGNTENREILKKLLKYTCYTSISEYKDINIYENSTIHRATKKLYEWGARDQWLSLYYSYDAKKYTNSYNKILNVRYRLINTIDEYNKCFTSIKKTPWYPYHKKMVIQTFEYKDYLYMSVNGHIQWVVNRSIYTKLSYNKRYWINAIEPLSKNSTLYRDIKKYAASLG